MTSADYTRVTIPFRDLQKPRSPEHRNILLQRSQVKALLRALDWRTGPCKSSKQAVAMALVFALRTGMRAGEICGLTWPRVKADYCELPVTKTRPRNVPLDPKALLVLARMRGWDKGLVFVVKAQTLDEIFRKAKAAAWVVGVTFHDSRHTAATAIARRLDVLDLCKMM